MDRLYEYCEDDNDINVAFRSVITYAAKWGMPHCFGVIETTRGSAVIFYNEWGGWVNVAVPYEWDGINVGDELYYGFSLRERRWASDMKPINAEEIERLLLKFG